MDDATIIAANNTNNDHDDDITLVSHSQPRWQASWYTAHRSWILPSFFKRVGTIFAIILIAVITATLVPGIPPSLTQCGEVAADDYVKRVLIITVVFMFLVGNLLFAIALQIRHFFVDSFGNTHIIISI